MLVLIIRKVLLPDGSRLPVLKIGALDGELLAPVQSADCWMSHCTPLLEEIAGTVNWLGLSKLQVGVTATADYIDSRAFRFCQQTPTLLPALISYWVTGF